MTNGCRGAVLGWVVFVEEYDLQLASAHNLLDWGFFHLDAAALQQG